MLPAVAASAYRIGSIMKFKGIDFLGSVDSIAKKTSEKMQKNADLTKDISYNLKSIGNTQKKIDKSKDIQEEILERQEKFLKNTNSKPKQQKAFGNVFKAMIQKPVEALQKLLLGLVIALAPKIISAVKKLINQAQLIGYQLSQFLSMGSNIVSNSLSIVQALIDNAINFDFTDRNKRLSSALDQWERDFDNDFEDLNALASMWELGPKELDDAIKALQRGEDPRTAAQPQETVTGGSANGATVNGTAEEYRIAAAIATEAGRGRSATDVLQVAANRVADDRYPNNFTDVFAQPGQFQGVFDRGLDNYRNINTAEDAAAFSGRSVRQINGYIADMRNADFRANSAEQVGGALEFRAAPSYYQDRPSERPPGTGADGRIPGSSWRGGAGDNQILRDPSQDPMRSGGAAPINYAQGGTTSSSSTPSSFTGSIANTQVVDELDVAKNTSSLGGLTPGQGFGAPRDGGARLHQGLDIGTYGARGFKVALRAEGFVARVSNDPSGYGLFVIIEVPSMGKSFMFAHLANTTVRQGDNYAGGAIGEIGDSGNSPGSIHLHFEVYQGGANGKAIDPAPYVGLLSIGRNIRSNNNVAAKLNIDDISPSTASANKMNVPYYDYDKADRMENQNTQVVMMTQPIIARQTTVVNKTSKSGGTTISVGSGGRTSAQTFNLNLLDKLS